MSSTCGAKSYKQHLVLNAGVICSLDIKVKLNAAVGVRYFVHDYRRNTSSDMLQEGALCVESQYSDMYFFL